MQLAFMANRQEVVLFGGVGSNGRQLLDTWTWKSGCWTKLNPLHSPPPNDLATNYDMAYDSARGEIVLVAGRFSSVESVEVKTWIWDGFDWTEAATREPDFPGPMAFDPSSQSIVMFDELNETWTWDGARWQQAFPIHEPGARAGGTAMTFDPATNAVLLFGGITPYSTARYSSETWSWNGSDWTLLAPSSIPPGRAYAAMAPFTSTRRVLLVGGENGAVLGDAWMWNGVSWSPTPAFGPRFRAASVEAGARVMVFGGSNDTTATNDMWWWDGASWSGP